MDERPLLPVNSDIELLSGIEKLNRTERELPNTCAHILITEHATVRPDAVAVSSPTGNLSYRQLNSRADAVAAWLSAQSFGEEKLIGVLGERNPDFLIGILGIWKAGAAYLALDPAWPRARLIDVLRQANCSLVLTTSEREEAWAYTEVAMTKLASVSSISARARTRSVSVGCEPRRLAYVIFTSGSTGRSKGAMIEHLGMLNHLFAKVNDLELTASDRVVQNASQAFDISVWQFIAPLVVGGSVRIVGNDVAHDPKLLLREVDSTAATVLEVVPSMLHMEHYSKVGSK
jgi:non-ribosomal peptide synthetase component F